MNNDIQVHFELLTHADRITGIAKLLLRRKRLKPHVFILCPDDDFLQQLDEKLWIIEPEAFLPHAIASENKKDNAKQPILLGTSINHDNNPAVLINGGLEVPPAFQGFTHIVDFVDAWDEDLKQASRERFKTYRQLSLNPKYLGEKHQQ